GPVSLTATGRADFETASGTGAGAGIAALGAAVSIHQVEDTIRAAADGAALTSGAADVSLTANSSPTIRSVTVGAAGADVFAGAGSYSKNTIQRVVDAHVAGGSAVNAAGAVALTAEDDAKIEALAGGLAGAAGVAL